MKKIIFVFLAMMMAGFTTNANAEVEVYKVDGFSFERGANFVQTELAPFVHANSGSRQFGELAARTYLQMQVLEITTGKASGRIRVSIQKKGGHLITKF